MHSAPILSYFAVLLIALFGVMLLAGLALFIYSIVAKKHGLTITLIVLPAGFVIVLGVLLVVFRANSVSNRSISVREATQNSLTSETGQNPVDDLPFPVEPWSNTLPPTADVYPSITLCGRPLAFQIAEAIRREKRSEKEFAVTFVKETRPGDHDQWKPPRSFVANFRIEFVKQFPGSTVVNPIREAEIKAEADPANKHLQPLVIKLSLKPVAESAGSFQAFDFQDHEVSAAEISARWTTKSKTRAAASINFIDKSWVVDPAGYLSDNSALQLAVGFSQRLARSPSEAKTLALENINRQIQNPSNHATADQILDRFVQKVSMPYGELWREAVLVDLQMQSNNVAARAMDGENRDVPHLELDREWSPPATSTFRRVRNQQFSHRQSGNPAPGLILTAIGLISIGLISNLLTQGYYRQNIKYTVITGVVVVLGLAIVALAVS